jgi:hypothetical protein
MTVSTMAGFQRGSRMWLVPDEEVKVRDRGTAEFDRARNCRQDAMGR